MRRQDYERYFERRVAEIGARLSELRGQLTSQDLHDRVSAAGRIDILEEEQRSLKARLEQLRHEPDTRWAHTRDALAEEVEMLSSRVHDWIATH